MKIIQKILEQEFISYLKPLFGIYKKSKFNIDFLKTLNTELSLNLKSNFKINLDELEADFIVPPTIFINAGYKQFLILFVIDNNINIYFGNSPHPLKEEEKISPTSTLLKGHMYIISGFADKSFTLEAENWERTNYILVRQTD